MKNTETKTAMILDGIFCLLFMPMLMLLGPAGSWISEWPLFFIIDCVYLYGCYWFIRWLNMPSVLVRRRYGLAAGALLLLGSCNYALTFYPHPAIDFVTPSMSRYQTSVRDYSVSLSLWLMFFAVLCYAFTISFVNELYRQNLLRKEMELQRDRAELAAFRAQISPHFLFNTLNSLYSLVIGTSQKAEDAFVKFADLLKYTYSAVGKDTVPIASEIEYIGNYIDLQSIRLNRHTAVEWSHEVDCPDTQVPPMLFLTFVENAFKYGASASDDCRISLRLELTAGVLRFSTRNRIMKHSDSFRSEMPVGIKNSRARLEGLYPSRSSLQTREADGEFLLDMTIKLDD
ncbi:MAG: histidine kinase [Muribaculaceae bacterium]|nr:histidine kinase [Muribaculaceae bacterium]MDE6131688.1 histidine kinase [Muribaculaceae bacterium]